MTYEELLEKARETYESEDTPHIVKAWLLANIIGPANESEDERIRKAIIAYINHEQHCGVSNADMIAWLEKQGEKLNPDKVIAWLVANICEFEDKVKLFKKRFRAMRASELMIGDWVNFLIEVEGGDTEHDPQTSVYTPDQVRQIRTWGLDAEVEGDDVLNDIDQLQPIPLTHEILEKNGFVKGDEVSDTPPFDRDEEGNMYYSYKGEHKFWGWWQPDNIYFIPANAMGNIEIKFVHQLQHAMRLCLIEKEIEL